MTDKEKQELYENICNDISCGTYILAPQYVDKLLAELEKENEELKERISTLEQIKKEHTDYTIKVEEERTYAKELLKKFIETSNPIYFEEDRQKVKAEAEQFLKE